jgi:hypothetical protein
MLLCIFQALICCLIKSINITIKFVSILGAWLSAHEGPQISITLQQQVLFPLISYAAFTNTKLVASCAISDLPCLLYYAQLLTDRERLQMLSLCTCS